MDNRTAVQVALSRLRQLGVTLTPVGDRIRCRPASIVPLELLDILKQNKGELLRLLADEAGDGVVQAPAADLGGVPVPVPAGLLGMPLDVFEQEGQSLEVKVAWWPETLFFVPTLRDAEALWREGVGRERVWTASELLSILASAPWTTEALAVVMIARHEFGGEVIAVGRSSPSSSQ